MKRDFSAPGVHVEEYSLLPKTVVQVETAIPAFIGFTEKAVFNGNNLHLMNKFQPLEINSFREYESVFGGAPQPASIEIELDKNNSVKTIKTEELNFMYYSVKLFFENGGGACLIVSAGNYTAFQGLEKKRLLLAGLASLEKTDTPTLLVIPDAAKLTNEEAGELHTAMLAQAGKLKNRFALLDLVNGQYAVEGHDNPADQFRTHLGMDYLSFGAAYYPWLVTAYSRKADNSLVLSAKYIINGKIVEDINSLFSPKTVDALQKPDALPGGRKKLRKPSGRQFARKGKSEAFAEDFYSWLKEFYNLINKKTAGNDDFSGSAIHRKHISEGSAFHKLLKKLQVTFSMFHQPLSSGSFEVDFRPLTFSTPSVFVVERGRARTLSYAESLKLLAAEAEQLADSFYKEVEKEHFEKLENLKQSDAVYNSVVNAIEAQKIVVPPGGAIAGVIAKIDRERGVWKAPANVKLNSVMQPAVELSQYDQENLNVDATAGKSINAIRAFTGKGTLVWGARTLSGNDNEWRYISVRRFCIMVEQSVYEAIRPFLFEENDAGTWQRVKTMIENFLFSLWKQGALQGIKPEQAYFVKAGPGETMTAQDIDGGVMNLEIGLAVLKPAEYIILKISNKMQVN